MGIKLYSKIYDNSIVDASKDEGTFSTYHNIVTYQAKENVGFLKRDNNDNTEYLNIKLSLSGETYYLQYTINESQNYLDLTFTDGIDPGTVLIIENEKVLVSSINHLTRRLIVERGYNDSIKSKHNSSVKAIVDSSYSKLFYMTPSQDKVISNDELQLFLDPLILFNDIDENQDIIDIYSIYPILKGQIYSNGEEDFKIINIISSNNNNYQIQIERTNPQPNLKDTIFFLKNIIDNNYHDFYYYTSVIKSSGESNRKDLILTLKYEDLNNSEYEINYNLKTIVRVAIVGTIGDSITAGHAAFRAEDHKGTYCQNGISYDNDNTNEDVTSQYQYWLSYRLGKNYKIYNYGTGEEVGYQVKNRFVKEILSLYPDYIIIQCGTNDLSLFNGASVISGISPDSTMDKWIFSENPITLSKNNSQIIYYGLVPAVKEMIELSLKNKIKVIIGNLLPRNGLTSDMKIAFTAYNNWLLSYVDQFNDVYMIDFFNANNDGNYLREDPSDETNYNMNDYFSSGAEFNEDGTIKKSGDGIHLNSNGYKIMGYCINIDILFNASVEGFELYNSPDLLQPPIEGILDPINNIYMYPIRYNFMQIDKEKIATKYIYNKGSNNELFYIYISNKNNCDVYFIKENEKLESLSGQLLPGEFLQLSISIQPNQNNAEAQIRLIGRPLEVI